MIDPVRWKWGHEYDELRQHGYGWRVAAYIAWASSPAEGRQPATLGELATKVLGLKSHQVISRWRKKDKTIDKTIFAMQAGPLMRYRRDAFEALTKSATTPDANRSADRRLFFTMTKDLVDRSEVDHLNDDEAVTGDQFARMRADAQARAAELEAEALSGWNPARSE